MAIPTGTFTLPSGQSCYRGSLYCDQITNYLPEIVEFASTAGIDPELLFAILMIEVNTSWIAPVHNVLDFSGWALDNLGVYGPLKSLVGKGDTPPSLGWGNAKADVFYETVANHPGEFEGVEWTDLIDNEALSMKLTAYRLADLATVADNTSTPLMRQQFTRNEVIAAMYNTYPDGYASALSTFGTLGPRGSTYAATASGHMQTGRSLICGSGGWSCS